MNRSLLSVLLLLPTAVAAETSIDVFPQQLELTSMRRPVRLIVTAHSATGLDFDVTGKATFASADERILRLDGNQAVAVSNGSTEVKVVSGGQTIRVPVRVELSEAVPVSLRTEVLPVLSRQSCSSGACHGSPKGKGGFRLSLRAFDPTVDETTLRNEFFGRRTNPLDPDTSLLLRKPLTETPHAGGRKLVRGTTSHRVLRQWIAEGTQLDASDTPQCESIQLYPPPGRELNAANPAQHFVVLATFSDGSQRDVTDLSVFTSSDTSIATVSADGVASRVDSSRGQAAITVRYLEHMATSFLVSVSDIEEFKWTDPPEANYIDKLVHNRLRQLQFVSSGRTTDFEFLRRVSLDVTGLLPTVETTRDFVADESEDKRSRLIDRLLQSPEHAKFMALKWGDTLRIRTTTVSSPGVFKYHRWLVRAFQQNTPYDVFTRQLLTSTGSSFENPPANFFRTAGDTNDCTESTAQIFLGARLECAKCHNHPHERWTQDNYYGLAAFFNRVQRDTTERTDEVFVSVSTSGDVKQPRTGQTMQPWLPGAGEIEVATGSDRREVLVDWLTQPDNPFFARVEVNRLWSQIMGRGLVEPIDDFRDSNPASNADLLDALAADFVENGFDRRHILRTILNSETYQRSSESLPGNEDDDRYFSRYPRRLMSAEQLLDAICDVTGVQESFGNLPAGTRATQLPSPDFGKEFLKIFGQPERKSVCRCERSEDLNLTQALQIANGAFVHGKLSNSGNRARRLLSQKRPLQEIHEICTLAAYSRLPTEVEYNEFRAYVERRQDRPIEETLEDLLWALVNSNEFLFQH